MHIILQGVGILICARFLSSGWAMGLVLWQASKHIALKNPKPNRVFGRINAAFCGLGLLLLASVLWIAAFRLLDAYFVGWPESVCASAFAIVLSLAFAPSGLFTGRTR